MMLADLEAVFRSLKSEPGLRPICHRKPVRAEGRLFITVIARQLVQVIRRRLAERGPPECRCASWTTLRRVLGGRLFKRADGRTVHVRKATRPEPPTAGDSRRSGHRRAGRRHVQDDRLRQGRPSPKARM